MFAESLSYALVQLVHNFGAVAVIGLPLFALSAGTPAQRGRRLLLWLTLLAWSAQALSGTGFAAVSQHFYGRLPDITGIAVAALAVKVASALLALALAAAVLRFGDGWSDAALRRGWQAMAACAVLALTAAAFLRWFS